MPDAERDAPLLGARGLSKSHGESFTLRVDRLDIRPGTVTAVLGHTGAGKTTLLRILAGLDAPDAGVVRMDGMSLSPGNPAPLAWRRAVTLVAQHPYFLRGTVGRNVAYAPAARGAPRAERARIAREALAAVGMERHGTRRPRELSGGESQLVALARALAARPRLLLLDEPAAHLDAGNARRLEGLIRRLAGPGGPAVLVATHGIEQAYRLADTVRSLAGGRLIDAAPENVFRGTAARRGGLAVITIGGGLLVEADSVREGDVTVAVDPSAIVVSREALRSSARNSFPGTLLAAAARGGVVRLEVDAGVVFSVLVTAQSYRELSLQPGETVRLTFKTTAVRVF
ncbi:MAG: TOBE-like domain-containing protein [bacterium]|nr:TOBE-like domain-containing protein [bacterium]